MNERSQRSSFFPPPTLTYLSIYVYIPLHISIFIYFFLPFEEEEKERKNPSGNRDIRSLYVPPRLYTVSNSRRRVLSFFLSFSLLFGRITPCIFWEIYLYNNARGHLAASPRVLHQLMCDLFFYYFLLKRTEEEKSYLFFFIQLCCRHVYAVNRILCQHFSSKKDGGGEQMTSYSW